MVIYSNYACFFKKIIYLFPNTFIYAQVLVPFVISPQIQLSAFFKALIIMDLFLMVCLGHIGQLIKANLEGQKIIIMAIYCMKWILSLNTCRCVLQMNIGNEELNLNKVKNISSLPCAIVLDCRLNQGLHGDKRTTLILTVWKAVSRVRLRKCVWECVEICGRMIANETSLMERLQDHLVSLLFQVSHRPCFK